MVQARSRAAARQGVSYHFGNTSGGVDACGLTAVAHEQNAVGQQNGFVYIVGDHEHGLLRLPHDAHELVLNGAPC